MDSSKPHGYAVCALITNDTGEILAVSRKDNPDAFGLPGGKVDPGEGVYEAVVREVHEETGLTFSNLIPIFIRLCEGGTDGKAFVTTTFKGEVSGSIQTTEKGVVKWISRQQLLDGPFGKYNEALFKALNPHEV